MKQAFIFEDWMIFDKAMRVYPQKYTKRHQKLWLFVPLLACSSPLTLVYKTSLLWSTKLKVNISGTTCPNLTNKTILKSSQKGFN